VWWESALFYYNFVSCECLIFFSGMFLNDIPAALAIEDVGAAVMLAMHRWLISCGITSGNEE
jgi:hypothetical protein